MHFRKVTFRTQAYLELEAYSEPWHVQKPKHIQSNVNNYNETFSKYSYLVHFLSAGSENEKIHSKKSFGIFLYSYIFLQFGKWTFLALILRNLYLPKIKLSLYFRRKLWSSENRKKLLRKNFLFQEIELSKLPWKKVNAWATIRLSWFLVFSFSIYSPSLIRHLSLTQWGCWELPNIYCAALVWLTERNSTPLVTKCFLSNPSLGKQMISLWVASTLRMRIPRTVNSLPTKSTI